MDLLAWAISRVATTFFALLVAVLHALETGLREPLQHAGIAGDLQTLAVAMVPVMSALLAVKVTRGIIRAMILFVLASFFIYVMLPLAGVAV